MQIGALSNEKLGHSLRLSSENLIYCHSIQEGFDKEYNQFCERIKKYLVPEIIYKNHLDVLRLGVVFTYKADKDEMAVYFSKYLKTGLDTLIGMGAILLDGAVIGDHCIIGAGAVVKENAVVSSGTMMVGVPAKCVRELSPEQLAFLDGTPPYVALSKAYFEEHIVEGER